MNLSKIALATVIAAGMLTLSAQAAEIIIGIVPKEGNPQDPQVGAPLQVVNAATYGAASGYKEQLTLRSEGVFAGLYETSALIFKVLGHTEDYRPTIATFVAINPGNETTNTNPALNVQGPAGATFSIYDVGQEEPTFSLLTGGSQNGQLYLTEGGNPGEGLNDPYGRIEGLHFVVDKPGIYTVSFTFADIGNQGDGAGPRHGGVTFTMMFEAVAPVSVPEPSTWALLGLSGLVGAVVAAQTADSLIRQ